MLRLTLIVSCGLVALAVRAGEPLVLERGDARAEIDATPSSDGRTSAVEVSLGSGGELARWRYDDTWLDPEAGTPGAELAPAGKGTVLLVHAYSGGAHCCWFLLAFDVEKRAPLGKQVESESPIRITRGEHGCALGAAAVPPRPACSLQAGGRCPPAFFCFDAGRFREVHGVSPLLRTPPPKKPPARP